MYYYVVRSATAATPTASQVESLYDSYVVDGVSYDVHKNGTIDVTADTEASVTLTGYNDNEALSVFLVAVDSNGNLQTLTTELDVVMGDDNPPTFAAGYPYAGTIAADSFDFAVVLNEAGTVHFAVLPKGSTAPTTVAEITGCTNADAVACSPGGGVYVPARPYYLSSSLYHVSFNLRSVADLSTCTSTWNSNAAGTTNTSLAQACPKLDAAGATEYDVWYVAEDDNAQAGYGRTNNVQSASDLASQKLEVTTADITAPTKASGFPKAKNLAATSVELSVNMGETGKAWYLVVPDAANAPTAQQVIDQVSIYSALDEVTVLTKGSWLVTVADTDTEVSITGLDDETAYSAYVVVQDEGDDDTATNKYHSNSPTAETTVSRVQFTTLDGTAPVYKGTYTPTVSDIDSASFSLDAQLDEVGKVYYLVVKRTTDSAPTPPTVTQVLSGTFSGTVACGHVDITSADTNTSVVIQDTANKASVSACQDPGNSALLALPGEGTGGATTGSCASCPTIDANSRYWVYIAGQDDDLNNMTSVRTIAVETTDETAPSFVDHSAKTTPYLSGNAPSVAVPGKSNDGVTLSVTFALDEIGAAYFMVVDASKTAPTPAQIRTCGAASDGTLVGTSSNTYTASDTTTPTAFVCGVKNVPVKDTGYVMDLKFLPSGTAVKVYVAAEDLEKNRIGHPGLKVDPPVSNLQSTATGISVTTADIYPPTWPSIAGRQYPRVPFTEDTDITEDDATISVALHEPGYVYYVVVPKDYTYNKHYTDGTARALPTVAEVMAGTGPGGAGNVTSGTQDVATGDTVVNITTASAALTDETAYDVYLVAEDKATIDGVDMRNVQTEVVKLTFTTRDVTAPTFAAGYPKVDTAPEKLTVTAKLNEAGDVYFVVVADGDAAPTVDEVIAGVDYGAVTVVARCGKDTDDATDALYFRAPEPSTEYTCEVSGLSQETEYDVYVIALDNVNDDKDAGDAFPDANKQTAVTKVDATTKDATPPVWTSTYPAIEDLTGDVFNLTLNLDEIGVAYYTVDAYDKTPPDVEDVRNGVDVYGGAVFAKGVANVSAASTKIEHVVTGTFVSETDYYVYVTAADDEPTRNNQSAYQSIHIRTPDVTPPEFVGEWTMAGTVTDVDGDSFKLTVQLNEIGTVYYNVVPKGEVPASAASAKQVAGSGSAVSGFNPKACGSFAVASADTNVTHAITTDVTAGCSGSTDCLACPKLTSETEYDVWIVAEDDGGHGIPIAATTDAKNLQAAATLVKAKVPNAEYNNSGVTFSFATADVTAPTFTNSTPGYTHVSGEGFDLQLQIDEPGVVWYALVNSTCATDPTTAQIRAGTDGCDSKTGVAAYGSVTLEADTFTLFTIDTIGLETRQEDAYVAYVYAEDDEPTGFTSLTLPNRGAVTKYSPDPSTADILPPLFTELYANESESRTGFGALKTTFNISVEMDEPGQIYYVAFPAWHAETAYASQNKPGKAAPTAAQVKAGKDYAGANAEVSGTFSVTSAGVLTKATTDDPLTDGIVYDVYVIAEDDAADDARTHKPGLTASDNLQAAPTKVQVTTADGTAPLFSGNPCDSKKHEVCTSILHSETYQHSKYPLMTDCAADKFTLTVNVDEPGSTVYYVVVADATDYSSASAAPTTDPTLEQIKDGVDYTDVRNSASVTVLDAGSVTATLAGTDYDVDVTFTAPSTKYYSVFVATEGPNGNLGDGDVRRTARTQPTKLAPCVMANLVGASAVTDQVRWTATDDSLVAKMHLSSPAVVSYVLLRKGSPAPSPTQVLNGKDSAGNSPACYDYRDLSAPRNNVRCFFADNSKTDTAGSTDCVSDGYGTVADDTTACTIATFTNLSNAVEYDLYAVATHVNGTVKSDETGPDSTTGTPIYYGEFTRVPVKATGRTTDSVAPFFKSSFPKVKAIKGDEAVLEVQLNEAGTVYYVVDENTAADPTPAQVKAGTDSNDNATALIAKGSIVMPTVVSKTPNYDPYNVTITGLKPKSMYNVHIIAEDDETGDYGGNLQSTITTVAFTSASTDAHLGGLVARVVNGGDSTNLGLVPPFKQSITYYAVFVNVTTSTVQLTPISNDTESIGKIKVNGTARASQSEFAVTVPHGKTIYEFEVTAGDGVTKKKYHLGITRAVDSTVTNSTLKLLQVKYDDDTIVNSTQMGGRAWPKCVKGCDSNAPARCSSANPRCVMDSRQTKYSIRIPNRVQSITVTAETSETGASVMMYTQGSTGVDYPGGLPGYTTGKSLASAPKIDLAAMSARGGSEFHLVVVAADGVTKTTYVVAIERYGPGVYTGWKPVVPSSNAAKGERYGELYGADDALTTRVGVDPSVRDLNVIPNVDVNPPRWVSSYPRTYQGHVSTELDLVVQLDEPGVVYYLILPDTARAPTAREVKEGTGLRSDAVKAGNVTSLRSLTQETTASVGGLSASTAYDVWFVAEDDAKDLQLSPKPNLQVSPVKVDFSTAS